MFIQKCQDHLLVSPFAFNCWIFIPVRDCPRENGNEIKKMIGDSKKIIKKKMRALTNSLIQYIGKRPGI